MDGLLFLLLLIAPMLILQRGLHRETQAIFLILTRRPEIAVALFALLFFPGVLIHETSHYVMARILGVRTGRFSLLPRSLPNGRLQLGYVETASVDWVRDALIGAAPLLAGGLVVAFAGLTRLGMNSLWEQARTGQVKAVLEAAAALYQRPDFWLWFYLAFVVSATMLPSTSDRRSWLPIGLVLGLLVGISLAAGAGPWMVLHLAGPLNRILQAVAAVFGVSVLIGLALLIPLWMVRKGLSRLTGLRVV